MKKLEILMKHLFQVFLQTTVYEEDAVAIINCTQKQKQHLFSDEAVLSLNVLVMLDTGVKEIHG